MTTSFANPFQPTAGANSSLIAAPGSTNRGLATITFGGRVFRFRTNPNAIWWSYELITHVEDTYGGKVVQLLGTRLGDLTIKVEAGLGGWDYLMQTVYFLRDMMSDQRGDQTGTFEYTTRNWKLKVYSMSVPFEDQVGATVREMTLSFKIQEDVTGVISSSSLDAALTRLQEGVYRPDQNLHNQYNDHTAAPTPPNGVAPAQPGGYIGQGVSNTVDSNPLGNNPGGTNPLASFVPSIPGFSAVFGGF